MNEIAMALFNERRSAREQDRPVAHIRVTTDALQGSVVGLPVSPERARATTGRLVALPAAQWMSPNDARAVELLVHPADWHGLLRALPDETGHAVQIGEPMRVFGIPVVRA